MRPLPAARCLTAARNIRKRRKPRSWRRLLLALLAFALPGSVTAAPADDYPVRPVRVIVPFSPGGAVDGPMRLIAQELSKRLAQSVFVENRPGAGATIGSEAVAKSAADGYTLLLASQTNAISATLYPHLAFDPVEDFAPVSLIGREPGVVVVNPSLPVKTLHEFIAYAKARPGQIDYASSGNGSGQHLFAALLCSMTGIKLNHVPYRGSGQATTDLLGGQVAMSIPGMAGMLGHINAGKLRALAVTGARRAPQLPDVPTVAEAGVPGYVAYVWMGLLAPKNTPAGVIDKLHQALVQVLAEDEVKRYMTQASIEAVGSTPAEFGTFFRAEKERWARIIRETGAKID
jgi:tripartite-type tricarboxylate transporter receptor subunit TctC